MMLLSILPFLLLLLAAAPASSVCRVFRKLAAISCSLPLAFNQGLTIAAADDDSIRGVGDIQVSYRDQGVPLRSLLGSKVTLIFNFAGQCDLPADGEPQCSDLAKLYSKYKAQGLQVLAVPTEQFRDASMLGERAPVEEIRQSLQKSYGIDFPVLDYVNVNGGDAADVYKALNDIKSIRPTRDLKKVSWNYEKYLLEGADGRPVRRYRPGTMPLDLEGDISDLINSGTLKPRPRAALGAV